MLRITATVDPSLLSGERCGVQSCSNFSLKFDIWIWHSDFILFYVCDQNFSFLKSFFYMFAYKCHVPEINLMLGYETIPFTYILLQKAFMGVMFLDARILCNGTLYA